MGDKKNLGLMMVGLPVGSLIVSRIIWPYGEVNWFVTAVGGLVLLGGIALMVTDTEKEILPPARA